MGRTPRIKKSVALLSAAVVWTALWALAPAPSVAAPGPGETESHPDIWIEGDDQFNPSHGVRKGKGTKRSPFVISGWDVRTVYIKDTSAHLVIKNNNIENLYLNWNGGHVTLVDNAIGDLRVNENIPRKGDPTSGLIARNQIGEVGQLRHFDGVFEKNTVGDETRMTLPFFSDRAVNFDGFHGSRFRDNLIYGYVDVRLHGHHHGSSFNGPSHYHGAMEEGKHHRGKAVDHTRRYHQVTVSNNLIYSPGPWALRYFDQAHSANDRTAASETNEALNLPHKHFTRVTFKGNKLYGSGMHVDIFNSDDELHKVIGRGSVHLINNSIVLEHELENMLWSYEDGITVERAQNMMLHIAGNRVRWAAAPDTPDQMFVVHAGIRLWDLDNSTVHIFNNKLTDFEYGVYASQFTETVHWWIGGLDTTRVHRAVYYDDSVANHPKRGR